MIFDYFINFIEIVVLSESKLLSDFSLKSLFKEISLLGALSVQHTLGKAGSKIMLLGISR